MPNGYRIAEYFSSLLDKYFYRSIGLGCVFIHVVINSGDVCMFVASLPPSDGKIPLIAGVVGGVLVLILIIVVVVVVVVCRKRRKYLVIDISFYVVVCTTIWRVNTLFKIYFRW